MRDEIREIVVQAVAGTKDLTQAIDELVELKSKEAKETILGILHSHSYNVTDQAGNQLMVVDDGSWDEIAEDVNNCFKPAVAGRSEQLKAFLLWLEKEGYNCDFEWDDTTIEDYLKSL